MAAFLHDDSSIDECGVRAKQKEVAKVPLS
jgi:hypothetical protein